MSIITFDSAGARKVGIRERLSAWIEAKLERVALARARRGIVVLERDMPGSVGKINLKTLDIGNGRRCALAQVYEYYDNAPRHVQGYIPAWNGFYSSVLIETRRLNRAWRQAIAEHRANARQ